MSEMKNTISFYAGHDSSATFVDKTGRIRVLEVERLVKNRYADFSSATTTRSYSISDDDRQKVLRYLSDNVSNPNDISLIIHEGLTEEDKKLFTYHFPNAKFDNNVNHHTGHAYCGHYQSGFDKSIIFSVDGGGRENGEVVFTKVFTGDGDRVDDLEVPVYYVEGESFTYVTDFGNPYSDIGVVISTLKKRKDDSLTWAGKIMGLCGYGNYRQNWVGHFRKFYSRRGRNDDLKRLVEKCFPGRPFKENMLSDQEAYDFAATSQCIFEEKLSGLIAKHIDQHPDRDVVMTGGCALNVLFNQKLAEHMKTRNRKVYIPPNPNDCGLSLGFFLERFGEELRGRDFVYDGIELLDKNDLENHVEERNAKQVTIAEVVDLLKDGKIIGVVNGDSEIGPRALGNRSIICDPSFENMKDTLNKKVKFREWYRPFAPVCLLGDSSEYFENVFESNYMSHAPKVREKYKTLLKSITHVDDTSRLQTVCEETGHEFFKNILVELKSRNEIPVILNTSFNIRGYPILTTIEDALHVLDNTELDYVLIEGYLFSK